MVALQDVSKSYGSDLIFSGVTAKIEDRDRIGLVGQNGAGKTTLLNIICGALEQDDGTVSRNGELTIGYQRQNSGLTQGGTILDEMRKVFADVFRLEADLKATADAMARSPEDEELAERYRCLEDAFLARDGYHVPVKINTVLTGMGFAEHGFDKRVDKLSGGEQTRLAIAKLLLEEPNLLILDEPTNPLDFKTLAWLEDYLNAYRGALLVVSHDRYFLDRLCGRIWEMDRGELTTYNGNYSKYVRLREERLARQHKVYEAQQEEIARLKDYVARNIVRATTAAMAKSRVKALERMEPVEKPKPPLKPPVIRLEYASEPVKDVLRVENLEVAVGEGERRRVLLPDVSLTVKRGEKVAIIGGNGAGKTSLLRCILGKAPRERGRVEWGRGVRYSYYDQGSESLDESLTVLDTLWQHYPRSYETPLRNMLGAVGLTGEDVFKRVGQLSGGERARLKLAIICLAGSNVLLLDEPTNHLDLATKEVLDKALSAYTGTILMISHDRYLLDRLPDRILEVEGGRITEYKGKFSDYQEQAGLMRERLAEAAGPDAAPEHRDTEGAKTYRRGKEARREEARRRKEYADTEAMIHALETELAGLKEQIAQPETAADYQLLQELCTQVEEKEKALSDAMDHWLELAEAGESGS